MVGEKTEKSFLPTGSPGTDGVGLSVFVHSSFRTSSTWLWKKFRDSPNTLAYCEYFNEIVGGLDARSASRLGYTFWNSNHPSSSPYFLEFLPLIQEKGGVPFYEESMAIDRLVPEDGLDGRLSPGEKRYVASLIQHASSLRKIPVLTGTRTLGRIRGLAKDFPGKSVFLHRNLFHQWASYSAQGVAGNDYFLKMTDKTLLASRHDPFLKALDDWFSDRTLDPGSERMFQAFLLLHLYLSAHAFDAADIMVDVTEIAADPEARREAELSLSTLVYSSVDLSDVRSNFEYTPMVIGSMAALKDTIDQFMKFITGNPALSDQSVGFVKSLKDKALHELERHDFFTKGARSVLGVTPPARSALPVAAPDAPAVPAAMAPASRHEGSESGTAG